MKDVVYILRAWYDNCMELRYSIRSLENINHWKVYIIWYKPLWLRNAIHIQAEDPYTVKSMNALHKIKIACKDKRISKDFILMNDDFYITRPTSIKHYNQWTIKAHIKEKRERIWVSNYVMWLMQTEKMFPWWLDFSIHCPMVYNKKKFLWLCEEYDMNQWYLLRNLYGNHYWIKWEQIKDYKIRNLAELPTGKIPKFISNCDWLIVNSKFREFLDKLFPEPSKYEKQIKIKTKDAYLYNNIKPIKLKWKPKFTINRFWERYVSDNEWYLTAKTEEERLLFKAYWFNN